MQSYSVQWTEPARDDLYEIVEYIAADSMVIALKIMEKIEEKAQLLSISPQKGRIVPELDSFHLTAYREIIESPWRLIYRIEHGTVYIIALLDGRRNMEDLLIKKLSR